MMLRFVIVNMLEANFKKTKKKEKATWWIKPYLIQKKNNFNDISQTGQNKIE